MIAPATSDLISTLSAIVGDRNVLTLGSDIARYATDWRQMFSGTPIAVVKPANVREVASTVEICARSRVGVVPQGGNTGLAGGAVPDDSGKQIVIALERMRTVHSVDPIGLTADVDAGCVLKEVKDKVADRGCTLPIGLASEGSAMIGGVIATNAGGTNVLRYGMARAFVLGLEVVLADGSILSGLRSLRKDNAGYDWKQVFIGSEGTLGIVTRALVRLTPQLRNRSVALLSLSRVDKALDLLDLAQREAGDCISGFELISETSLELVEKHHGLRSPCASSPWSVLIEMSSSLPGIAETLERILESALEREFVTDGVVAQSGSDFDRLWALRHNVTEAEAREGKSLKHDISLPIPSIPRFLDEAKRMLALVDPLIRLNLFGHLGDGNLHYNVLPSSNRDPIGITQLIHDLAVGYGGSISAEHGIGQYRRKELADRKPVEEMNLCRQLKGLLDPAGIMNPGKVL